MMTDNQKAYLVVGLPRSGTSAVAGTLHYLGIPMVGMFTLRKDKYNSKGYFENLSLVNINVRETNTKTFTAFVGAMKNAIDGHRFAISPVSYERIVQGAVLANVSFGFKDPRFVLPDLLQSFCTALEKEIKKENIHIILTKRNFTSTIQSLRSKTVGVKTMSEDELLYILAKTRDNILSIVDNLGYSYMVVDYDRLVEDKLPVINRIAGFCNMYTTEKAVDFIDSKLRRY